MALDLEERVLIARAIKRDPEAFSQLYVQFYDSVLRRVSIIVKNHHDAEDITNEAFLRAWNAMPRFQVRDISILAWFSIIAERLALKQVKNRRPSVDVEDVILGAPLDHNPDVLAEHAADVASLKAALESLPEVQREIVSRHFLEDRSYSELGLAFGKPEGTVRVIQHRALKALRVILSDKKELPAPALVAKRPAPVKVTR
jgi:RNA polymerase sigma-70 factor (ECF subfamily)